MKISPDLTLPIDAATSTFGILATRGAGKSNAAVVMAEEMYDAGVPWVAIDPKGDWWGLRSSENGKSAGLPIIVFGGRHGDVPLEPTAGQLIASLVLEQRITCVLDVSQFTKADTIRFLLAFGTHLFRHADDGEVEPIHLFLEEAHEYLPQQVSSRVDGGDLGKVVNTWQRIVKQGRFKGLGCTMISQRSSVLNKDVLELIDTLIVLRTVGPLSRKAIAGWVAGQDVDDGLLDSLPTLKSGEAWVWSPGELGIMQRIQFRRRRTFDSGATPKVGEKRRTPSTIADVDLAAIKEQMAETIEKAKATDPKELTKRIRELEKQLAAVEPVVQERIVEVEVPVIDQGAVDSMDRARTAVAAAMEAVAEACDVARTIPVQDRPSGAGRTEPHRSSGRVETPSQPAARPARPTPAPTETGDVKLERMDWALLGVLVQRPNGLTRDQVALFAGYSPSSGAIDKALARLRRLGWITKGGARITATPDGAANARPADPLPDGPELLAALCSDTGLPNGFRMERMDRVFLDLTAAHPGELTRDDVAERAGYAPSSGAVDKALARLRRIGFVAKGQPLTLTAEFDEAIR